MCTPGPDIKGSHLVATLESVKKSVLLMKCCGWTWMGCCCIGLACCIPAVATDAVISELRSVVAFYTPDRLHKLAELIGAQQRLFIQACTRVNARIPGNSIFPSITLMDAICAADSNIGAIVEDTRRTRIFQEPAEKTQYKMDVYNEYAGMGGNTAVVLYGLPEYMALINDPTCDMMISYYKKIISASQLNTLVMSNKVAAGF